MDYDSDSDTDMASGSSKGLWDTATGANRHWKIDVSKSSEYEKLSQKLWRTLTRAIMSDTLAGANMKMVMRDDFPADGDQGDGRRWRRHGLRQ